MKILYLITKSEIGGAQVHVLDLMKHMKEKGHEVGLMSFPGGWLEEEAKKIGVSFFSNKYFSNAYSPLNVLRSVLIIKKTIKIFGPNLVHCHSSGAGFFGRLAIMGKIPTIFTAHSWAFTEGTPFLRKVIAIIAEKIVSTFTSKIICVSEFDKRMALKYNIASSSKLVRIYNAVPKIKIEEKQKNLDKETLDILSVGRFAYPKRFDLLIESIKNLPNEMLNKISLNIIGFGEEKENLNNLVKRNKLEKNVFIKQMSFEDLKNKISDFDIFILISKHEGLPITILEAMSAGLPVIASNVGGIPEEIDSSCGILVENNKRDISEAIIKLAEDIELRKNMGEKSKERIKNNFSFDRFLSDTESVYEEALLKS